MIHQAKAARPQRAEHGDADRPLSHVQRRNEKFTQPPPLEEVNLIPAWERKIAGSNNEMLLGIHHTTNRTFPERHGCCCSMTSLVDLHRLVGRPRNGATGNRRMQCSEVHRETVEWQARQAQPPAQLSNQSGIIEVVTFVSAEPLDDGQNGSCGRRPLRSRARGNAGPVVSVHGSSSQDLSSGSLARMERTEADRNPVPGIDGGDKHGEFDNLLFREAPAHLLVDRIGNMRL